jgi:hypothetical protein
MVTTAQEQNGVSSQVKDFLSFMKHEVDTSHDLYNNGISTELAATIEKAIENPLKGLIDAYNSVHSQVKSTINNYTLEYFKIHKELIERAFKVDSTDTLTYYIVLKEDTSDNRDIFLSFLSGYELLGIEAQLPIIIRFLPKRVLDKSGLKDEILFN